MGAVLSKGFRNLSRKRWVSGMEKQLLRSSSSSED